MHTSKAEPPQQPPWMAGNFCVLAHYFEPGAMKFLARLQITPGLHMLDVACGSGKLALPAARAGAHVTGIDTADSLIADAVARATAEDLPAHFDEGSADDLPYEDESFDLVVSLIGAMFTPRPQQVAAEMVRVCRVGGHIVMGNWTPQGAMGKMLGIIARYSPLPPGMSPPALWGDEETVRDRFNHGVTGMDLKRRLYPIHYPFSVPEMVEFYRVHYHPAQQAFQSLDAQGQAALRRELEQHWTAHNHSTDGLVHIMAEYLEIHMQRVADR